VSTVWNNSLEDAILKYFRICVVAYDVTLQRRIRELCAQAVAAQDPGQVQSLLSELRQALRQHVEQLQSMVIEYPFSAADVDNVASANGTRERHKKAG
jgi:hypothetical protein